MSSIPTIRGPVLALAFLVLVASAAPADEFDSAGVTIRYDVRGEGEPVLLIHGLHASARINWELPGITERLAKEHRVIALDNRGHGGSGRPEGEDEYGEKMMEDAVRLLDHLGIEKAHVVGYSMGGMIAMKLLATHPDRVRSAVLGGMGWMREGGALSRVWELAKGTGDLGAPEECVRSLGRLAVSEEEVRAIQVPVLVLVGDRDPVRRLYVDPLARVRPDWPIEIVEGAGHMNCVASPEFAERIEAFLGEHREEGGK